MKVFRGGRRGGSEIDSGMKSEINTAKTSELVEAGTSKRAVK